MFTVLFFFNYTTTHLIDTYGHPLSLHDAPPISVCGHRAAHRDDQRRTACMAVHRDNPAWLDHQAPRAQQPASDANFVAKVDRTDNGISDALGQDRKSTRLNSRH